VVGVLDPTRTVKVTISGWLPVGLVHKAGWRPRGESPRPLALIRCQTRG
jgi:hypothetical protein